MKQKILNILVAITLIFTPALAITAPAYAACGSKSAAKDQVLAGVGETGGTCDSSGVTNAVAAVVNILSIIVGIAAVVVVIVSAFKYITSGGDSNKVANAKNTLIYAMVGLVVAAFAQALVHFVINQSDSAIQGDCPTNKSIPANHKDCKP